MTTTFTPAGQQQDICDSEAATLLVLGGAGTGKTVTAAAAARAHLIRRDAGGGRRERVLFLTFSRTAVTQILDRSRGILKDVADRVDVLTFHGFAWRLITDFGRYAGYGTVPKLHSEAERKLLIADPTVLAYSDLLPAALRIVGLPVIGDRLAHQWSLIVCDEFQDADEQQWKLLEFLAAAENRMLLLGDPNQMIYDKLPGRTGTGRVRLRAALARPGARQVKLKLGSYRDPSQLLPAVAEAVRQRRFNDPALAEAIACQRLRILTGIDEDPPAHTVCREVEQAYANGARTVGVFMHRNEPTAALSAALTSRGVDHVAVGLSESYGEALSSIAVMLAYAEGTAGGRGALAPGGVRHLSCAQQAASSPRPDARGRDCHGHAGRTARRHPAGPPGSWGHRCRRASRSTVMVVTVQDRGTRLETCQRGSDAADPSVRPPRRPRTGNNPARRSGPRRIVDRNRRRRHRPGPGHEPLSDQGSRNQRGHYRVPQRRLLRPRRRAISRGQQAPVRDTHPGATAGHPQLAH